MFFRPTYVPLLILVLALAGCPSPDEVDGGTGDDAGRDGGALDGGRDAPVAIDGGMMDVPEVLDVLVVDAPEITDVPEMTDVPDEMDAGMDAGVTDTGVDAPTDTGVDAPTDTGVDAPGPMSCAVESECAAALSCLPSLTCGCPARMAPVADGMGRSETLHISEIVPGMYIEVYNDTDAAITLGSTTLQFCSPFNYAALTGTVPARGYATLPWPTGFSDTLSGGEVILYRNSSFGTPASVMDFVCWGTNPHGTRMATAVSAGRWTGSCAPAITGGAIHRRVGTDGTDASDYDTSSPPSSAACTP